MADDLDELRNQEADAERALTAADADVIAAAHAYRAALGPQVARFLRDQARRTVLAMETRAPAPEKIRALRNEVNQLADEAQQNVSTVLSAVSDTDWLRHTVNISQPLEEALQAITSAFRTLMQRYGIEVTRGVQLWQYEARGRAVAGAIPKSPAIDDYQAALDRRRRAESVFVEAQKKLASAVTAAAWDDDEE
jgi:hypothetical protein